MATWCRIDDPFPPASVIAIAGLAFAGWPIVLEAGRDLQARHMTMENSVTIAIAAAAAVPEFFTALVVTLFELAAEELEHLTPERGRMAIRALVDVVPPEARVQREDERVMVVVEAIRAIDVPLVGPGEKIPVDGPVTTGHSSGDQARIGGESMPAEKAAGAVIYGGSINQMDALAVLVERVGRTHATGASSNPWKRPSRPAPRSRLLLSGTTSRRTIGVDLPGMGLAALGHLASLLAAAIRTGSEFVFVMNSALLLPLSRRTTTEDRLTALLETGKDA